MTKHISKSMREALDYAKSKYEQDQRLGHRGLTVEDGWFYAQFTTRGSIDFFCRPQTLAALARRGLLECHETHYADGYIGRKYRYMPPTRPDAAQEGGAS